MTTETTTLPTDLITIKQAARLVNNTHRATIRRWILKGKLRAYTLGKRYLVSTADVLGMIRPHVPPAPPENMPIGKRDHDKFQRWVQDVLKAKKVK